MRTLVLVDLQNDFLPGGALAIPRGNEVIPLANRLQPRFDLVVAGEEWLLEPGDVISFRADQRHSYANPTRQTAVGYSVVLLAPISAR